LKFFKPGKAVLSDPGSPRIQYIKPHQVQG
jgi:hypothetical protein